MSWALVLSILNCCVDKKEGDITSGVELCRKYLDYASS